MKTFVLLCLFPFSFLLRGQPAPLVTVHRSERLFGTEVSVTITAETEEIGYINIEEALAEMRMLEKRISAEYPESETHRINAAAGLRPTAVGPEYFNLIQRAGQLSELTSGAFDITAAALDTVWRFDGSMARIPGTEELAAVLPLVGYRQVELDPGNRTVYLPRRGMKISMEGIGIGYAVDRAKDRMQARRVPGGLIRAGGVISAWGTRESGQKWLLGIADPVNIGQIVDWIPLIESSVAIVRTEREFVRLGSTTFGGVLDPRTGMPVRGLDQVTVMARSAELSEALAHALCVLGPERGIRLVEQLGDTEAILVDSSGFMFWSSGLLLTRE